MRKRDWRPANGLIAYMWLALNVHDPIPLIPACVAFVIQGTEVSSEFQSGNVPLRVTRTPSRNTMI